METAFISGDFLEHERQLSHFFFFFQVSLVLLPKLNYVSCAYLLQTKQLRLDKVILSIIFFKVIIIII